MPTRTISRRHIMLGALFLPGCTTLSRLNAAATPRDTYDLLPANLPASGSVTRRNLLVADPTSAAVMATDRILMRPAAQSIAYLPDARWSDTVPGLVQSLLVRTLSSSGQIGFVGTPNAGPIPDVVLLTRIDRFDVDVSAGPQYRAALVLDCTLLRDSDQRVITSRRFSQSSPIASDAAPAIAATFQNLADQALPEIAQWVFRNIAS